MIECPYCHVEVEKLHKVGNNTCCSACKPKKFKAERYGLTLIQYLEMFAGQKGRCAICLKLLNVEGNRMEAPCIDHCHELKHVRGILCGACNLGLGSFYDSEFVLEMARKYLIQNRVSRKWWATEQDEKIW